MESGHQQLWVGLVKELLGERCCKSEGRKMLVIYLYPSAIFQT